jgi:acetyl-CoA acetyltransferase
MMMREVAICGVGMTPFGKYPAVSIKELGCSAVLRALKDANLKPEQIQKAYCGNALSGAFTGQEMILGHVIMRAAGLTGIPILKVENACSSGSSAFTEAWMGVAGGFYDLVLVLGVEKLTGTETSQAVKAMASATDIEMEAGYGLIFPGAFALLACKHMEVYGSTVEDLAAISVKNHNNGLLNEYSQYRKKITIADVLNSKMIAEPLRLLDCCPFSDGAAAVIICPADQARKYTDRPVYVAASVLTTGQYLQSNDLCSFPVNARAAKEAYEAAGIGPEDIDLAEVHDCFSIAELLHYEDLGFCGKGEGQKLIRDGATMLGGHIPVNVSGGLLAKGHPVGATGIAQIIEITEQLRGEAGARQVKNAAVGLTHCNGGFMQGEPCVSTINILKR